MEDSSKRAIEDWRKIASIIMLGAFSIRCYQNAQADFTFLSRFKQQKFYLQASFPSMNDWKICFAKPMFLNISLHFKFESPSIYLSNIFQIFYLLTTGFCQCTCVRIKNKAMVKSFNYLHSHYANTWNNYPSFTFSNALKHRCAVHNSFQAVSHFSPKRATTLTAELQFYNPI